MRQTFRALVTLLVVVLVGCAGQPKPVEPPVKEDKPLKVTPVVMALVPTGMDLQLDYAQPLLTTLRQTAFYRTVNSARLASSYAYAGEINTGNAPRLVQVYRQNSGESWGYITTSATQGSVANAFQMENTPQGTLYALVLKQARICLATQASGAPAWNGHKLVFASQPGFFECTGMTNSSLFQPGSSIPAMLGPYYGEGDTVLVFKDFATLNRVMSALSQRLPEIRIPKIY